MVVDFSQPHRRYNPLNGSWVQVSPHRLDRPWQGEESEPEPPAAGYDATCYLCPGNARKGGEANPDYDGVYVFENDFPALKDVSAASDDSDPLFRAESGSGTCRVMCFSPDHSKTIPELSPQQIRAIIDAWIDQAQELGERYASVQIFENKGAAMGCSNPHPHGQIWATSHLPTEIAVEDQRQCAYWDDTQAPMLLELAAKEVEAGERVVELNEDWIALVPYWAAWPFETLLLPRATTRRITELAAHQRNSLALILKALTTRYDNLFNTSFPYSMGWHGAPFGMDMADHWQLHAHFYPPLLRSASVRKFMVGYEMLAEPQRDLTPERAAEMLRSTSTTHYRSTA